MENLGRKTAHWFTKESRTNEGKRLVYTTSVKDMVKVLDFVQFGGLSLPNCELFGGRSIYEESSSGEVFSGS